MKEANINKEWADNIRPCPYCGAQLHRVDREFAGWDEGYYMQCPTCGAYGKTGYTVDLAIEAWNNESIEI